MDWRLHWLEAAGDFGPWRARIATEIEAARSLIAGLLPVSRLDIMLQRLPAAVIPEIGMVGHAYRSSLLALTMDPDNPNFDRALADGTLRRQVAHEVHHCGRMGAVGYGGTLGEALVSEGLAGRFVGALFGSPPEPWERAVDEATLRTHLPQAAELNSPAYDHASWFFGADGGRPRWLGYTLAYHIAGDWLAAVPAPDADTWVGVDAATVLAAAHRGILAARR